VNLISVFGNQRTVTDLTPNDFRKLRAKLAKTRGAIALRTALQRVRSIFKFAFDAGLILAPIRFGQAFAKPKLEMVRRAKEAHKSEHGLRMFESADLRKILAEAKQPLKAMVLLAANCAFGQTDLANLPTRSVDLDAGWLDFVRVKTAVPRRIPLWPETVAAIREWLPMRPKAKVSADSKLLYLTVRGAPWVTVSNLGTTKDAIGQGFLRLIRRIDLKRSRRGFYALRNGFETVGGEILDQVAVDSIMGHVPQGMSAAYRERIGDDRLRRVVGFVHGWLWPDGTDGDVSGPKSSSPKISNSVEVTTNSDDEAPALKLFAG